MIEQTGILVEAPASFGSKTVNVIFSGYRASTARLLRVTKNIQSNLSKEIDLYILLIFNEKATIC